MIQPESQPKIVINVNTQRDGHVFALRPRSRLWLEAEYPDRVRVSKVFIGVGTKTEFGQLPEAVYPQVLALLTGLSWEELKTVGGFRLYNPITEEEQLNLVPAHV